MDRTLAADFIVNLCGAIGLVVALMVFRARDPRGPLTRRFVFALGLVAMVFLLRGLFWLGGSIWFDRMAVVLAAFIPLAALLVAEGMLRRHAPRWAKLCIVAGCLVIGLLALLVPEAGGDRLYLALALFQLAAFSLCGVFLIAHPRGSLSVAEERGVIRLCLAAFFLLPFVATDFPSLLPGLPVRLGGLGALVVVIFALLVDRAGDERSGHAALVGLRIGGGLLVALAIIMVLPGVEPADAVRLAAVTLSGVLLLGLVGDVARAQSSARQPGLLDSISVSAAHSRDELLAELLRQPLFRDAVRLREADLSDYDPPVLRSALHGRAVLRLADYPWGQPADAPMVERLQALMASHGASHLIVAAPDPLDMVAVRVPLVVADRATETALAMAGRLLAAAPETAA